MSDELKVEQAVQRIDGKQEYLQTIGAYQWAATWNDDLTLKRVENGYVVNKGAMAWKVASSELILLEIVKEWAAGK